MPIDMSGMSRKFLPKLLGKIAIGRRNASGYPEKLDYFIFTHPFDPKLKVAPVHKDMTAAMKELYKDSVDSTGAFKPRSIKVVLPFHNVDEVFYTSFCNYTGTSWNCKSEDGVTAVRKYENGEKKDVPCVHSTCEWKFLKKGNKTLETCKANGLLSVLLLDAPVSGGLWRFSTRSSTSINEILNTLKMLYNIRGSLMGLEVNLKVRIVTMDTPAENGGTQKQNVPVVSIELPYSWKALANGSGTVYGDFKQIIEAAKTSNALPNKQIINELSSSMMEEVASEGNDEDVVDASIVDEDSVKPNQNDPNKSTKDEDLF